MQLKKAAIIPLITLVFIAIALSVVTAGILNAQQNIPAQGHLGGSITTNTVNISVYSDSQATTLCSNIDWGTLITPFVATKTIYVKNTGNITETLSMTAKD